MAFSQAQHATLKVVQATERGSVDIDISDIFDGSGSLRFLDSVQNRGLIEVRQGKKRVHLKIGGIVGYLPVTNNLILDIKPKFSISNLARLVAISEKSINRPADIDRFYKTDDSGFFPEAILRSFAHYLSEVLETGLQKKYSRKTMSGTPRPKINFGKSQQKHWARGNQLSAIMEVFEFTGDIDANRLIKSALLKSLGLIRGYDNFLREKQVFVSALNSFKNVPEFHSPIFSTNATELINTVSTFRKGYVKVIPIAIELLKRSSVVFEHSHTGVILQSYLLELDIIFEQYIRNFLVQQIDVVEGKGLVKDGNKSKWSRKLLYDSNRFEVRPDLVFCTRQAAPCLIGDTKYKIKPSEEDRYQIISHALAYNVNSALLIYPVQRQAKRGLHRLGNIGTEARHIEINEYYFDLSGNLEAEERKLADCISELCYSGM